MGRENKATIKKIARKGYGVSFLNFKFLIPLRGTDLFYLDNRDKYLKIETWQGQVSLSGEEQTIGNSQ